MKRVVIGLVALVVLGGAFGAWWYLIRDDTPPPAALPDRPDAGSSGDDPAGSTDTADGQWSVAAGEEITTDASGNLTVHGETRPVTIPIEARWSGDVIDVAGSLEVALADFGMTPPERPFVSVSETGTMEFQLAFERAG